jgi:RNA polymerase sigma-70 factor (ECF subfamily)
MMNSKTENYSTGQSEKELLYLLQMGDESAFTTIYNHYWKKLFSIAANKLHDLTEAEELVQDIFLDMWKRKENLVITSSLPAYLGIAVKYKVIDRLARKAIELRYRKYAAYHLKPIDSSTEEALNLEDLQGRLVNLVAELPEKCRLVFELSRNRGLSQKQIAHQLGIAEKTVESHLGKALRTLRMRMGSLFVFIFLLFLTLSCAALFF